MLRVIAISALLTGLTPGVTRGASWHRPVSGRIVGTFSFSPAAPYAAGQRRGIVIAARPGATVRAACAGDVAFAGNVGRAGPTLSVQCGRLRATYQGIAHLAAAAGDHVIRGEPLAVVGARGALHLGARAAPGAYVDPATLLADRRPPLGPAPRAPRAPRTAPPPARAPLPRPRPEAPPHAPPALSPLRFPRSGPAAHAARAPGLSPLGWIGLCLLAAALPTGTVVGRARRDRRAVPAARAAAPVAG